VDGVVELVGPVVGTVVGEVVAPPPQAAARISAASATAPARIGRSIVTRWFLHWPRWVGVQRGVVLHGGGHLEGSGRWINDASLAC
jgi:hypothetical protein